MPPNGEFAEGRVIAGEVEDGAWDLDAPFTIVDDFGEQLRVGHPWACRIVVLQARR